MFRIRLASALPALLFAVGPAQPSDVAARVRPALQLPPDTVGCLDTLRASDSISAVVKLTVRPQDTTTALPPDFEGFFAQEFKSRSSVPPNLPLSVMRGMGTCDSTFHNCTKGVLWLSSTAYALARRDGTLSRIGVVDESLTPGLAKMVQTVLEAMSGERVVPQVRRDQPIEIAIRVEAHPDTVPRERQLFRVRLPRYDLPFTGAAALKRENAFPKYPRIAEMSGIGDSVMASFTIMADGSVNLRSFDFESGRYRDFIQAVIKSVEKAVYQPARIGACQVATWTRRTFMFVARP